MSDHRCRLRAHPYASHYFKSPVHRTRNKCMLGSDGKFDISGVGLYYATIVKSCATVVRRPILSHALSRLRRRNKHRFEGDLRSFGECTLPNHFYRTVISFTASITAGTLVPAVLISGVVPLRHLRHVPPPPDGVATLVNSLQNRVKSITLCVILNAKNGK